MAPLGRKSPLGPLLATLVLATTLAAQDETPPGAAEAPPAEAPPAAEALLAGEEAGGAAVRHPFRLYPDPRIGYRLSPTIGIRVPDLDPTYSPRTLDFYPRERAPGPQFSLGLAIDVLGVDGERESAKAQEFRDLDQGPVAGVDFQRRGAETWLRLTGRHLGREDQDLRLDFRRYGQLRAELFYNQIPHHFAFDARSLYRGVGSGVLEIDDAIQESLQGSGDLIAGARLLEGFIADATRLDLALRRDRLGVAVDWTAFDPVAIELQLHTETRDGVRPWSGSFGLGSLVEIPWPVDYDSSDMRLRAEYAGKGLFIDGTYRHAEFDNNIPNVRFDNPWRATDANQGGAVFRNGPTTALIDLYPDNEQQELTLNLVKHGLPKKTRVQATVSIGRLEQNDEILPYTTNTAFVPGSRGNPPFDLSDPANRPAERAGARFDTELVHLRISSKPLPFLELEAYLRDYRLINESAVITIPGFVREDVRYSAAPSSGYLNLPIAYDRRTLGVELGLRLGPRASASLGFEREDTERAFREVAESDEGSLILTLDLKPAAWADLRLSYRADERDVGEYDFAQFFREQGIDDNLPILPFLRKFDQAARDRDRAQLIASFYPSESLSVGLQAIAGRDDYPESRFGVLDDEHEIYQLDLAWTASERLSLYAAAGRERYDVSMRGREWFPTAVSDPFRNETGFASNSNWTARSVDRIESAAFGLDAYLVPERLRLELAFSWTESDGALRFTSPLGTPADDLNPFDPADFENADDVRWYSFAPELEYRVGERLYLGLRYLRERYRIDDFNLDGFRLVPVLPDGQWNGALFMGTLFRDFELDVWTLQLKLTL